MNRRPVVRGGGEQTSQAEERCRSTQADPQGIAKVLGRQAVTAWHTRYTERPISEIPGNTKEHRDSAEIKKHSEERSNGNDGKCRFERNRGVVKIEECGDAIAHREDDHEPDQPSK